MARKPRNRTLEARNKISRIWGETITNVVIPDLSKVLESEAEGIRSAAIAIRDYPKARRMVNNSMVTRLLGPKKNSQARDRRPTAGDWRRVRTQPVDDAEIPHAVLAKLGFYIEEFGVLAEGAPKAQGNILVEKDPSASQASSAVGWQGIDQVTQDPFGVFSMSETTISEERLPTNYIDLTVHFTDDEERSEIENRNKAISSDACSSFVSELYSALANERRAASVDLEQPLTRQDVATMIENALKEKSSGDKSSLYASTPWGTCSERDFCNHAPPRSWFEAISTTPKISLIEGLYRYAALAPEDEELHFCFKHAGKICDPLHLANTPSLSVRWSRLLSLWEHRHPRQLEMLVKAKLPEGWFIQAFALF